MSATYIPIQSTTLSSNQASVTFSNIPQTFTDLVLRASTRLSGSAIDGVIGIQLNGGIINMTVTNLRSQYSTGTAESGRDAVATNAAIGWSNDGGSTSNTFTTVELYIPNYAVTTANKQISSATAVENNATQARGFYASLSVQSNSAITSLTITRITGGANFVSGSTFHLYGISNA